MKHHHKPRSHRHALPLTTGRVGLSQTTGLIEFQDGNPRGTGNTIRAGQFVPWPKRPEPPRWKRPSFSCRSWSGCSSCGGSCGSCFNNTRMFAAMLTDSRWWDTA